MLLTGATGPGQQHLSFQEKDLSFKFGLQWLDKLLVQPMYDSIGIGKAQIENEMRSTSFDKAAQFGAGRLYILGIDDQLHRALDGLGITSNGGAVFIKNRAFVLKILNIAAHAI